MRVTDALIARGRSHLLEAIGPQAVSGESRFTLLQQGSSITRGYSVARVLLGNTALPDKMSSGFNGSGVGRLCHHLGHDRDALGR